MSVLPRRRNWRAWARLQREWLIDFNNLIGSIFAASDLALAEIPADSAARENIDRINAVATRASEIVNLLIAYAGGHGATENVDHSAIVKEMATLLKGSISRKAVLSLDLAPGLPTARVNATQLRQVVVNLLMNASESLAQREGVVTVTTDMLTVGPRCATDRSTDVQEGQYCRLLVSDTGCGIDPQSLAKIFDPFYTTKFIGRGLGLSVVQGILRSIGGTVHAWSTPGLGSTFEVLLPSVVAEQSQAAEAAWEVSNQMQANDVQSSEVSSNEVRSSDVRSSGMMVS